MTELQPAGWGALPELEVGASVEGKRFGGRGGPSECPASAVLVPVCFCDSSVCVEFPLTHLAVPHTQPLQDQAWKTHEGTCFSDDQSDASRGER